MGLKDISSSILFMKFFSSWFFVGYIPFAPGTMGTLAAMPLYMLLSLTSTPWYLLFLILLTILGLKVSNEMVARYKHPDPQWIVVDEVLGYLVTMAGVSSGILWMFLGFLIFRFFDILKPFPIKRLERVWGGVIWDDLLAGFYGNLSMKILELITR